MHLLFNFLNSSFLSILLLLCKIKVMDKSIPKSCWTKKERSRHIGKVIIRYATLLLFNALTWKNLNKMSLRLLTKKTWSSIDFDVENKKNEVKRQILNFLILFVMVLMINCGFNFLYILKQLILAFFNVKKTVYVRLCWSLSILINEQGNCF
jgi:hypothetical protein